eukprot:7530854-Pyramimonas_sp.AAC.1
MRVNTVTVPQGQRTKIEDYVVPLDDSFPWQHEKYSPNSSVWQAAAQRRRQHPRRTNKQLGTMSVDLSGPHEPAPIPGYTVGQ